MSCDNSTLRTINAVVFNVFLVLFLALYLVRRVAKSDIVKLQHRGREFAHWCELEFNDFVIHHLFSQPRRNHLCQRFFLALCLPSELGATVAKPCNVLLHVSNLLLLPLVLFHLVFLQLGTSTHVGVVVACMGLSDALFCHHKQGMPSRKCQAEHIQQDPRALCTPTPTTTYTTHVPP